MQGPPDYVPAMQVSAPTTAARSEISTGARSRQSQQGPRASHVATPAAQTPSMLYSSRRPLRRASAAAHAEAPSTTQPFSRGDGPAPAADCVTPAVSAEHTRPRVPLLRLAALSQTQSGKPDDLLHALCQHMHAVQAEARCSAGHPASARSSAGGSTERTPVSSRATPRSDRPDRREAETQQVQKSPALSCTCCCAPPALDPLTH